jgi:hypothetical protein
MKDLVERLRGEMLARYLLYVEDIIVDLRSGNGQIEFRCGFALHADHTLRTFTVKGPAKAAVTDSDRQVIVEAVFSHIQSLIDEAVAETGARN